MRNILRLGVESKQPFTTIRLGREEAEIISNVAENAMDQADAEMEGATRMIAVTDGLEDLACIAEQIEQVSPTEQALIETSARMAVAGSDVAPEEIVPGMENMGTRLGMEMAEDLRDRAKQIWDGVMKSISGVWEKITTWMGNIFSRAEIIRSAAEEVRASLKAAEERQNRPLVLGYGTSEYIMTASKVIKNTTELKAQIKLELEAAKWVFEVYSKELLVIGSKLAKAYTNFNVENVDAFIKEIKGAVIKDLKFPGRSAGEPNRFPNTNCFVGAELLTGVSLVERIGVPKGEGELAEMDALYNTSITMDNTHIKGITPPKQLEFAMPSFKDCEDLLKDAEEIADMIEKFSRGSLPKELQAVRKEIDDAIAKNPEAIAKAYGNAEKAGLTPEQQALLKAAASMTVAFTNWVKNPIRDMVMHIDDVAHTALWIAMLADERYSPAHDDQGNPVE